MIAAGRHALITAPTGSGKTLTAFLWALDAFAAGRYATGATRVSVHLAAESAEQRHPAAICSSRSGALRARFEAAGDAFPAIRVQVRSGDTSSGDRQRMLRRPPEILITTPESLALLLTTARGRAALASVRNRDPRRNPLRGRQPSRHRTDDVAGAARASRRRSSALRCRQRSIRSPRLRRSSPDSTQARAASRSTSSKGSDQKQIQFRVRFPEHVRAALDAGQKIWEPLTNRSRKSSRPTSRRCFLRTAAASPNVSR